MVATRRVFLPQNIPDAFAVGATLYFSGEARVRFPCN